MTTQILSRKARITAIITALVMLLTALCYMARPTFALADYWDDNEFDIDHSHVCTADCYQNIYYLTDNPAAEYYVDTFLSGLVDMYAQQHTAFNEFKYYDLAVIGGQPWRLGTLDRERFGNPVLELHTYSMQNALIIYELNELLPFQFSYGKSYQPTYQLYDTFYELKLNNCRIMFICNTDETLFNDRNGSNMFLDLVDVHINTDIYSFFTESFLTFFMDNSPRDTTIILDQSMAKYAIEGDWSFTKYTENEYREAYVKYHGPSTEYASRYGFLDGTLISHIREIYWMSRQGAYPDNRSLLLGENIKILCHLGEQMFYDLTYNRMYYWPIEDDEFMEKYQNNHYYFVGSTRYGDDSYDLRRILMDIEEDVGIQGMFNKYMFVEYGSYHPIEGESNMHVCGLDSYNMAKFIAPIIKCFLFDDIHDVDWGAINNWDGRCEVTVKPTSENSWLLPLSDSDDTITDDHGQRYYYDDRT